MFRNQSASSHSFAMVPRADIPRSAFNMEKTLKTTFDVDYLVPFFCEEVYPGDEFGVQATIFCRMATPLTPIMDNLWMESFYFFVPNRLTWSNWQRFMGERDPNPDSSIDFLVPTISSPAGGYAQEGIFDMFGLPVAGPTVDPAGIITNSVLPLRGYNRIWNEWFRDQNLQESVPLNLDDGPDAVADYNLLKRGKRHDYFTSCLPWPQKGDPVEITLAGDVPVVANEFSSTSAIPQFRANPSDTAFRNLSITASSAGAEWSPLPSSTGLAQWQPGYIVAGPDTGQPATGLIADMTDVAAITINELRTAFQMQKLLERDARGGTRYTEIVRSHFGVISPDARLQRTEYLGGTRTRVGIQEVQQTAPSDAGEGGITPLGRVGALSKTLMPNHGFRQSFTEHGYVIGLLNVRADLTYQQGMRRFWSRQTRDEFYFPAFANLGEQAVLQKELVMNGVAEDDELVFGYQERWAELRYNPNQITGRFRSDATQPLDSWHLAQSFAGAPPLGAGFIESSTPIDRVLAVTDEPDFLCDVFFKIRAVRPLPMYSVPGLIDHF